MTVKSGSALLEAGAARRDLGDELCWHQRQFARLQLCRERLAASDAAMRRGDYGEAVQILKEELDREPEP